MLKNDNFPGNDKNNDKKMIKKYIIFQEPIKKW